MAIAVVLTLALGIGATTAVFSVANALVLRPLPVENPQELVTIPSETAVRHGFQAGAGWNHVMWAELGQRADAFGGAFAWILQRLDLSEGGEMQPATALFASGELFTLGVEPVIGRTFTTADDVRGGGPDGAVAVISHGLWQRRYHRSPDVLGSRLPVEGTPVTIIGVVPEWFTGVDVGQPFDVAMPFGTEPLIRGQHSVIDNERALLLTVMLRLKPGQAVSEATAALRAIQPQIVGPEAPEFLKEPFLIVDASTGISDRSRLRQQYQRPLIVLSIISGIVLLIVCLNIANLLLSRAAARRTELSVRLALGASRWRIAQQHLLEALTLGTVGTADGMLLAAWASRELAAQLPFQDGSVSLDLSIDWRVLIFTVAVAAIATALFGTVPAVYATGVPPIDGLRDGGRGAGGRQLGLPFSGLIMVQVALSVVLVASAGLFVKTATRLTNVPLGFEPDGLLVVSVNSDRSLSKPAGPTDRPQRMLEAVTTVPGLTRAAGSVWTPVGIYMPFAQSAGLVRPNLPFRISIRTTGDPGALMPALAETLRSIDAGLTYTFRPLVQDLRASVAQERLLATLAGFFGAVALLLSAVGVSGVSAYAAGRRRAEIGIRLALGGQRHTVLRVILGRIVLFVLTGTVAGALATIWLSGFVAALLYGVDPHDATTLLITAFATASIAVVAAWLPAWRAARADPAQVLREH